MHLIGIMFIEPFSSTLNPQTPERGNPTLIKAVIWFQPAFLKLTTGVPLAVLLGRRSTLGSIIKKTPPGFADTPETESEVNQSTW